MERVFYRTEETPVGELLLISVGDGITGIHMDGGKGSPQPEADWIRDDERFAGAAEQLAEYFAGARVAFDLPLAPRGTPFQRRVWDALREIPYGETISYAQLARRIDRPKAMRAVGAANGRNPIGIVVPCHRVIGADGSLTGYGGGLDRKRALLEHEARVSSGWRGTESNAVVAGGSSF